MNESVSNYIHYQDYGLLVLGTCSNFFLNSIPIKWVWFSLQKINNI